MHFVLAAPSGYEPDEQTVEHARQSGLSTIEILHEPQAAVRDADVIYTDVWTSMGQESEQAQRRQAFLPFQVNEELLSLAGKDCLVMHCLPAHRGEEITDEVIDGPHSIVFDQAENRMHIQKAFLVRLMER